MRNMTQISPEEEAAIILEAEKASDEGEKPIPKKETNEIELDENDEPTDEDNYF